MTEGVTWDDTCPWCGEHIDELSDHFVGDGDAAFECPHCEKRISGEAHDTVEYRLERAATAEAQETPRENHA